MLRHQYEAERNNNNMCISRECVRVRTCHASSSLGDDDRLEVSGIAVMCLGFHVFSFTYMFDGYKIRFIHSARVSI